MRKTSRRSFTKSIATAIAAVPVVSSLVEARSAAIPPQETRAKKIAPVHGTEEAEKEHDTPPPIILGEGSLIVERLGEYAPGDIVSQGNRNHHKMNPDVGKTKLFPAHIKVLDGSGEILYRNDDASRCLITLDLLFADPPHPDKTAVVNVRASPVVMGKQTFNIDTDDRKLLRKTNEKPTSKKRDVRYRHKDDGGTEFSINQVTISEGTDVLYRVKPGNLASKGDDFKVMVWLEQS